MSDFRSESSTRPVGLFSTTQINHLMRVEFSRAQRYGYSLSLLVIALDDLDTLREAHGFDASSEAMDRLVSLVREGTRACDHLGRLMDQRLVVVLPHTPRAGAESLAKRLVGAAAEEDLSAGARPEGLTLSVGGTTFEDGNTMFFDTLLEAGEQALVAARRAGGGSVHFLSPADVD